MKTTIKSAISALALTMCWCLSAPVAAREGATATRVPLESMTQTEYENYRRQLNQQMNGGSVDIPEPDAIAADKAPGQSGEEEPEAKKKEEEQSKSSGYGKGYRARMERSTRTGRVGGFRGGAMSRGGGRNR